MVKSTRQPNRHFGQTNNGQANRWNIFFSRLPAYFIGIHFLIQICCALDVHSPGVWALFHDLTRWTVKKNVFFFCNGTWNERAFNAACFLDLISNDEQQVRKFKLLAFDITLIASDLYNPVKLYLIPIIQYFQLCYNWCRSFSASGFSKNLFITSEPIFSIIGKLCVLWTTKAEYKFVRASI